MSVYQKDISRILKNLLLKYETQIATTKKERRKLEHFGIVEISLLDYLADHDRVSMNDLIDQLQMKRSKALAMIKKMLEIGYLKKEANENDRRSAFISLDHQGLKLLAQYRDHESQFLEFVLKDMTINEEKAIVKFLSKINQTDYMK
ncbi:MAG: MarR family transcriptional regulator [Clostridia bacterium]|nr:MarR family transcriptional regulator [Clostridia bacterium]